MKVVVIGTCKPRWCSPMDGVARDVCDIVGVEPCEIIQETEETILMAGLFSFCSPERRKFICEQIRATMKRLTYVNNDYMTTPPTQVRHVMRDLQLRNVVVRQVASHNFDSRGEFDETVQVAMQGLCWKPYPLVEHECDGLIYYGSLRPRRMKQFEKWLGPDSPYLVRFSCTTSKQEDKWFDVNCRARFHPKIESAAELARFEWSLILEDPACENGTVDVYPPNRFFECLGAGVPMLFVRGMERTMKHGGIVVPEKYYVDSPEDLKMKMMLLDRNKEAKVQRSIWGQKPWRELALTALKGVL